MLESTFEAVKMIGETKIMRVRSTVCSSFSIENPGTNQRVSGVQNAKIIRQIEKIGGAAKICGAGAFSGPTGVILCYHPKPSKVQDIAKTYNLSYRHSSVIL